jgi:hypothetical protein
VSAHKVRFRSGFRVFYGPVRAADIKAYLAGGMTATPEMRRVTFTFAERMALVPVELAGVLYVIVPLILLDVLFAALGWFHFTAREMAPFLGAPLVGADLVPALLPWIPGRPFSVKGAIAGAVWAAAWATAATWSTAIAYFLVLPALSAFTAMNFTGSSTFTSLSGVKREMAAAIPAMAASALAGALLLAAKAVWGF